MLTFMTLYLFLWSLLLFQIGAQQLNSTQVIGVKSIPVTAQTYNWDPRYRCRLVAHGSAVLQNADHHILVFDSGTAKFQFNWSGGSTQVMDLNGWTATIDLSQGFDTKNFAVGFQIKKAPGIPVVNRFGVWADGGQNSIYIQGGHFYTAPGWNESQYHVDDGSIPPYSIWKFDLSSKQWINVTERGNNKGGFKRALGVACASVPSLNQSFCVGGIATSRSDPTTPPDLLFPQAGMLVYDHSSGDLQNVTYGTADEQGYGFWHGSLGHMKLGPGKGFLISLMAEKGIAGYPRPDLLELGNETGIPVTFDYVLFYDLENLAWYKQKTTYIDGDLPVTRTRFCGQTIYSNDTNTWELWIYGGQLVDDKGTGVDDIYILSMPSFIWTRVSIPYGGQQHIRSHSCHAIGSQLVVLGGYPPGFIVDPNAACSDTLVQVIDMNRVSLQSYYSPNTVYSTPSEVRGNIELDSGYRRSPYNKPWANSALKAAFESTPPPPPPPPPPPTPVHKFAKWKIAVAVCVPAVVLAAAAYCFIKRRKNGAAGAAHCDRGLAPTHQEPISIFAHEMPGEDHKTHR